MSSRPARAADGRRGRRLRDAPDRPRRRAGLPDHAADADHPDASRSSSRTGARTTEIVNVESEHSAMSAAVGSALAGARTMTATSSQGLALMAEVVYIAAAMRAPIVMALGNRALSGPINIHCDHSDSMLIRDSGVDPALRRERAGGLRPDGDGAAHRRAPRRAAAGARLPGRLHDHALRRAGRSCSPDDAVRAFVGEYAIPFPLLDLAHPTTQGPFAMPDYYYELRHQQARAMEAALAVLDEVAAEFAELSGPPLRRRRAVPRSTTPSRVVCLGSTAGTVEGRRRRAARRRRARRACCRSARSGRSRAARSREALGGRRARVAVLDRADSPGGAPPLFAEVAAALHGAR